ncbi:MAG: hypothetical protein CSA75_00200 [Sorangium cellulosum]|nr:MAG: hypothetical protein CSA75_00200 [Sorangium cellulosum]
MGLDTDSLQGVYREMTQDHFETFLASVPVESTDDGWSEAPAERHITLYAAHEGVALTVSKVEAVKCEGDLIRARTRKGEAYMVVLADIFAMAVEAPNTSDRKAGFAANG